jgi:hypothetical protein
VAALHGLATAYQSLSSAAQHNHKAAYGAAQSSIGKGDASLSAALAQLQQDGYTIG